MFAEEVYIQGSTVVFGKISEPIFARVTKFFVTESCLKNTEFCYRPLGECIREIVMNKNDYYGVLQFNMVHHIC